VPAARQVLRPFSMEAKPQTSPFSPNAMSRRFA
jgi:hypothetical protein